MRGGRRRFSLALRERERERERGGMAALSLSRVYICWYGNEAGLIVFEIRGLTI